MSWKRARLEGVPALGPAAEREYWARYTDLPGFGRRWHSVRRYLGIKGFGTNANEADAGELLVVRHSGADHANQQEIYLILRGRARFVCDGEEVDVAEGEVLYLDPETKREATALETPTTVFMVGGIPSEPYRDA